MSASNLAQAAAQAPPLVVPDNQAFILVISRDLDKDELDLLKEYGKVVQFEAGIYTNIPIRALDFDYFIIDIRKSEDRYYFQSIPVQTLESYNLVSVCYSIQKSEEYHEEMGVDNVLAKLPPRQAFKADFDRLMLQKKISRPNGGVSCIKSVFRLFNGQWN
jgi:hypothetical protein